MITSVNAQAESRQPTVSETIQWLLSLERPPLPVAPAQDPHEYPKLEKADAKKGIGDYCPLTADLKPIPLFTGKNPSYVDAKGKPHIVSHRPYQKRMPTDDELKKWFASPQTGIGTLGSPEDIWLDFDVKNFSKAVECRENALAVAQKIHELSGNATTVEETHSGGYRVYAAVPSSPGFTNFTLEPGGKHVGEALGEGRFTVLAPTIGPSGNPYVAYYRHDPNFKPLVPSLEDIDINPSGKSKALTSKSKLTETPIDSTVSDVSSTPSSTPKLDEAFTQKLRGVSVELAKLCTKPNQEILQGANPKGDRSDSLTAAVKDLYGWANWCRDNAVTFTDDVESLAVAAGERMEPPLDTDKVGRILKTIDASACTPAAKHRGKTAEWCANHVLRVAGVKAKSAGYKDEAEPTTTSADNERPKAPPRPPSPKKMGEILAKEYRQRWRYWCEKKQWMEFNGKVWRVVDAEAFLSIVWHLLKRKNIEWDLPVYVESVAKALKNELMTTHWPMWDRKRYIAFADKVWDNQTGKLLDYEPGMGFLSHLPYNHAQLPSSTQDPIEALQTYCPKLFEFMNRAMGGNRKRILKLLAIVNAAIKFRFFDLQMFVFLVGKPGTGKGTFSRILRQIIGNENSANTTLAALDEPTEMAAVIDKQLVTCADERRQHGIDTLLRLTGGDKVRYREIYKPRGEGFFYALLMILSNTPVFAGDVTGLKRRTCLVEFVNPIPKTLRDTKTERQMDEEIPALIPIALMLSDTQVTSLIKGLGEDAIPEFKRQEWEMQIQVSPLAAWVNECLIHDSGAELAVGDGAFEARDEGYSRCYDLTTAYGNYLNYCRVTGVTRPLTRNSFSPTLEGLCHEVLDWVSVKRKRNKRGVVFQGLRLRENGETAPYVEEIFEAEGVHRCRPGVDLGVDLNPLPDKGGVDYVDLDANNENVEFDVVNEMLARLRYEELYGEDWEAIFELDASTQKRSVFSLCDAEKQTTPSPTSTETIEKLASRSTTSTPALPDKGFRSTPESSPGLHRCTPDEVESLPELRQAVTPEPTLAELKALLFACASLDERDALKAKHGERLFEAYRNMSEEEQLHVDGLTMRLYPSSMAIYKVVGQGGTFHSAQQPDPITLVWALCPDLAATVGVRRSFWDNRSVEKVLTVTAFLRAVPQRLTPSPHTLPRPR